MRAQAILSSCARHGVCTAHGQVALLEARLHEQEAKSARLEACHAEIGEIARELEGELREAEERHTPSEPITH